MVGKVLIVDTYVAFLGSIDLYCAKFSFSLASSYFDKGMYLTDDNTFEDIYPCVFVAKVQTHTMDNTTYKDILRVDNEEKACGMIQ